MKAHQNSQSSWLGLVTEMFIFKQLWKQVKTTFWSNFEIQRWCLRMRSAGPVALRDFYSPGITSIPMDTLHRCHFLLARLTFWDRRHSLTKLKTISGPDSNMPAYFYYPTLPRHFAILRQISISSQPQKLAQFSLLVLTEDLRILQCRRTFAKASNNILYYLDELLPPCFPPLSTYIKGPMDSESF